MTAPMLTEGSRLPSFPELTVPIMFDGDNGVRFRLLRPVKGLLWDRVAEASTVFKEEN